MKKWILLLMAILSFTIGAMKADASVSNFQANYDEGKRTLYFSWEGETSKRGFKLFKYSVSRGVNPYSYYVKKVSGIIGFMYPQSGEYEAFVQDADGNRSAVVSYIVNRDGTVIIK